MKASNCKNILSLSRNIESLSYISHEHSNKIKKITATKNNKESGRDDGCSIMSQHNTPCSTDINVYQPIEFIVVVHAMLTYVLRMFSYQYNTKKTNAYAKTSHVLESQGEVAYILRNKITEIWPLC